MGQITYVHSKYDYNQQFIPESEKTLCSFRHSKNEHTSLMEMIRDIDALIQRQTRHLFKLDPLSMEIVCGIARHGPQNVYMLHRLTSSRYINPVRTRIKGSHRFVGLEKEWFISVQRTQPFRETEPRHTRYYNLLFKGFLASLTAVRLEENRLFSGLIQHLNEGVPSHIRDEIVHYIKYEMAAWLQTHKENHFELTYLKDALNYYLKTKDTESFFRHPEANLEPVFTDGSLETLPEVLEVENFRSIYSETWAILAQNKNDLETSIYDTSNVSTEFLNEIFRYWPNAMLHRLQEPS